MNTSSLRLHHELGRALELKRGGETLWRYDYGSAPKPFFHPLRTPRGFCLSLFQPHDHIWHRGLWFTIKFVNGLNFWEENGEFGSQHTLLPPRVEHFADGSFSWESALNWKHPSRDEPLLRENRRIIYRPLEDDAYALDWNIELRSEAEVMLDRTPFSTWGGYGGLTLRGNRNWHSTQLRFPDGTTSDRPTGQSATWCDFSGTFDGGANCCGGLALFDHPANPRHPTPWYGTTGAGHYLNAAFLFHEPLIVRPDEPLVLRYRALVHDDAWETSRLNAAYEDFIR